MLDRARHHPQEARPAASSRSRRAAGVHRRRHRWIDPGLSDRRAAHGDLLSWPGRRRAFGMDGRDAPLRRRARSVVDRGAQGRQALDRRRGRQDQPGRSRPRWRCAAWRCPWSPGAASVTPAGRSDKLESIPGFRVDLSVEKFTKIVGELGACLIGQTERIAPADRKLYALRDVTGTVESAVLIASSIMSKKLAEGIDALVLDCKVGSGAFMKTPKEAHALAQLMMRIGAAAGKPVTAVISDMSQPLGVAVGNANEVAESIAILRGGGPGDVRELTVALGAEMLLRERDHPRSRGRQDPHRPRPRRRHGARELPPDHRRAGRRSARHRLAGDDLAARAA